MLITHVVPKGIKNSPESAKYLNMAMDMFFTLLDDPGLNKLWIQKIIIFGN